MDSPVLTLQSHARGFLARTFVDRIKFGGASFANWMRSETILITWLKYRIISNEWSMTRLLQLALESDQSAYVSASLKETTWRIVFCVASEVLVWYKLHRPEQSTQDAHTARRISADRLWANE